ncbi:hypothetical protein OG401_14435 [Kitasatospora purpeofusca]|uniref:hypothetical protein n=1 Tax=Kitasatospora purpeofusca TaxID=67352 RepID=UPI002259C5F5|nr:hypothetical protein [Kitasatospora purpeofusca]MCX4685497.1 hypothetical protein [Kitasatospora purpeofusca]
MKMLTQGTQVTQALATLKISNTYADGVEIETVVNTLIPLPLPAEGTDEREDWEYEYIFLHTGTGRSGDAWYTVDVASASVPELRGLVFEFGG